MTKHLYSRHGADSVRVGEQEFTGDKDGKFEFPDDVADQLHRSHVGGTQAWEDNTERQARLEEEREAKRRDPATLLDAVEALQQKQTVAELRRLLAEAEAEEAPKKPAPKPKTTK